MIPIKDVAIIVPAYNASGTVRETLDSIQLQQAGLNRLSHVILADDHSADGTSSIAQSCWNSEVPLLVSRNSENKGERMTVNEAVRGLPESVRWFFILHSDDIAKPNWLNVILRGIDNASGLSAAFTASYDLLFPDGRVVPGENLGEEAKVIIKGSSQSIRDTLMQGCWFKISSCAIRAQAFHEVGGFEPDMPQLGDWDFVLRLLRAGWTIEYIPLCLSFYRQTQQSVSSKSFKEHRDVQEALVILNKFRESLPARDMTKRHCYYFYVLSRRAVASILRRDFRRLRTAARTSIQVVVSYCKILVNRGNSTGADQHRT